MRLAWGVAVAIVVELSAIFAWMISQPFEPSRFGIFAGVVMLTLAALWLLSRGRLGPALEQMGVGRAKTTAERRLSTVFSFLGLISILVMQVVIGQRPPFFAALAWLLATFAVLMVAYAMARRIRRPAAG
ncbi:MAG TPA: hypothetical protein VHW91_07865 [Candidatus Dormibacteraeota bacterium]|jgi:hypothetical protein|nr:hypothetical protein [Candidatus Dormibacteraeota bacterium]